MQDRLKYIINTVTKYTDSVNWNFNSSNTATMTDSSADAGIVSDDKSIRLISKTYGATVLDSSFCQSEYEDSFPKMIAYLYSHYKLAKSNMTLAGYASFVSNKETPIDYEYGYQFYMLMMKIVENLGNTSKNISKFHSYKVIETEHFRISIQFIDSTGKLVSLDVDEDLDTNGNKVLVVYLDGDNISSFSVLEHKLTISDMAVQICGLVINENESGVDSSDLELREIANKITKACRLLNCKASWKFNDMLVALHNRVLPLNNTIANVGLMYDGDVKLVSLDDVTTPVLESCEDFVSIFSYLYSYYKTFNNENLTFDTFITWLTIDKTDIDYGFICQVQLLMLSIAKLLRKTNNVISYKFYNSSNYYFEVTFENSSNISSVLNVMLVDNSRFKIGLDSKVIDDISISDLSGLTIHETASKICDLLKLDAITEIGNTPDVIKRIVDFTEDRGIQVKFIKESDRKYILSDESANVCVLFSEHNNEIYLVSMSDASVLVSSSYSGINVSFEKLVSSLYVDYVEYKKEHGLDASFTVSMFITIKRGILKCNKFDNDIEFYCLMNAFIDELKSIDSIKIKDNSVSLDVIVGEYATSAVIGGTSDEHYKIALVQNKSRNSLELVLGGKVIKNIMIESMDNLTINDVARKLVGILKSKVNLKGVEPQKSDSSDYRNLRLVALKYEDALIGFRFKADNLKGYDISVDIARVYGITAMKVPKVITLENRNGLLLSKSEISSGNIIEDISDNAELISKLFRIIKETE